MPVIQQSPRLQPALLKFMVDRDANSVSEILHANWQCWLGVVARLEVALASRYSILLLCVEL